MDFFTGQIIPVAFGYAPKQTALCNGQSLPVNQNAALYALLGNTYGGSGSSFNLPNVQGRTLVGFNIGAGQPMGATGGEASHTLTTDEIPAHTHALNAVTNGSTTTLASGAMPATAGAALYGNAGGSTVLLGGAPLSSVGGGQGHPNLQPSTAVNVTIVLYGVFPTRS